MMTSKVAEQPKEVQKKKPLEPTSNGYLFLWLADYGKERVVSIQSTIEYLRLAQTLGLKTGIKAIVLWTHEGQDWLEGEMEKNATDTP